MRDLGMHLIGIPYILLTWCGLLTKLSTQKRTDRSEKDRLHRRTNPQRADWGDDFSPHEYGSRQCMDNMGCTIQSYGARICQQKQLWKAGNANDRFGLVARIL